MDEVKNEADFLEVNIIEEEDSKGLENALKRAQPQSPKKQPLKVRSIADIKIMGTSSIPPENADKTSALINGACTSNTGVNVSIEDWPGECDFKMDLKTLCSFSEREKASDATYSHLLDKLYCDINKCFSIRFILGNPVHRYDTLTIRTMMVYNSPADMAMPVLRCPNHKSPQDPINRQAGSPQQYDHVIWATEHNAKYEKNESSGRVSVVIPFGMPHMGSNYVAHVYKFTCIGSCAGGINRRNTSIVFTLEHQGKVIGRQSLSCRICSCPKRDKKSQESAFMKQSMTNDPNNVQIMPPSKKRSRMGEPMMPIITEQPLMPISASPSINEHPEMYLVPVYGYDNFLAVSKFAEYLDSTSGALEDAEYYNKRAKMMAEHNKIKIEPEDEEPGDELVIDQEEGY